jgi:hypothetical protein
MFPGVVSTVTFGVAGVERVPCSGLMSPLQWNPIFFSDRLVYLSSAISHALRHSFVPLLQPPPAETEDKQGLSL